jgi:hypothetical protein
MEVMLDYVMRYGSSLQDILISKLTAFYNSAILQYPSRLLIVMPNHMKIHQVDRHKVSFDEVAVIKFDPSNPNFWRSGRLAYYVYYLSALGVDRQHIYIDYGKVFRYLQPPQDSNAVFMAATYPIAQEKVAAYLGKLGAPETTFPIYHCGCFSVPDILRSSLQKITKELMEQYTEYVDEEACYVLMSYALFKCQAETPFKIELLNEVPIDIANNSMVEDFYVLV